MSSTEPTPEALAASPETGSEDSVARTVHARRRTPAFAFLGGALAILAVGALIYFLLAGRAETPATPTEAVVTDQALGLPAPDGAAIRAQVDAALAQAPRDPNQPAEQAAEAAQAQTAPEADDSPAAAKPATPAEAEAVIERDATRNVQARQ